MHSRTGDAPIAAGWRRTRATLTGSMAAIGLFALGVALAGQSTALTPPDAVADVVYGQLGIFSTNALNQGGRSADSLWAPAGVAADRDGNLYVADNGNSRILFYPEGSTTATRVYGQLESFTTGFGNIGGRPSPDNLLFPEGIALDADGNLYVADRNNNRVLFYEAGSTTASRVYGQNGNFTTNLTNGGNTPASANGLFAPYDVLPDADGNLYVADAGNNRVLFFPAGTTTPARIYGQHGDYTTYDVNKGGRSADTFFTPRSLALDSKGNLYVADRNNNRVLMFPPESTTAIRVYGQGGNFTTGGPVFSATGLAGPEGVALDRHDNLYVVEVGSHRVLFFPADSTTATHVFGQDGSFTTGTPNKGGISADSLSQPRSVVVDRIGNLYVADVLNHRVLKFNRPPDTTAPAAAPLQSPAANGAGWNNTDVTILWSWSDDEGGVGIDPDNCTQSSTSSGEGEVVTLAASCSDLVENTAEASAAIRVDKTAPTVAAAATTSPNAAGWYRGDVVVAFTCADALSGVAACPGDETLTAEGDDVTAPAAVATDAAGNDSAPSNIVVVKIDKTAPTVSAAATSPPNAAGWYTGAVTVAFACADALSGIVSCPADQVLSGDGAAIQSSAQTATDDAGNASAPSNIVTVSIDRVPPSVSLTGGPADGGSYSAGAVPAAPTCTALDSLSGLDGSCSVSGYSTAVGRHTITAGARDRAGNEASVSATYTVIVSPANVLGFYSPVDMGGVWNVVNGGATVPLKFEIFDGATELTSPSVVVQPLTAIETLCGGGPSDDIELVATGETTLRYDAGEGRFIYNWKTPKKPGYCYVITVQVAGGSGLTANFRLK